jgi:hypothetical protein
LYAGKRRHDKTFRKIRGVSRQLDVMRNKTQILLRKQAPPSVAAQKRIDIKKITGHDKEIIRRK